jgi:exonuclease I
MIKNFQDKNGNKYNLILRGRYSISIKSSRKLKMILDNSTSYNGLKKLHPMFSDEILNKLVTCYQNKNYMDIMREFGLLNWAQLIYNNQNKKGESK